jgi:hypothetical protein
MYLLGTWLRDSKVGAADATDAANLEYGARNLLTLWGGDVGSSLAGYDGKIWQGLLKDVYAPVWSLLLEAMKESKVTGVAFDKSALGHAQFLLNAQWVHATNNYTCDTAGSAISAAHTLIAKYSPSAAQVATKYDKLSNLTVSGFDIGHPHNKDVGTLSALCAAHSDCVGFTSTGQLKSNIAATARKEAAGVDLFTRKPRLQYMP